MSISKPNPLRWRTKRPPQPDGPPDHPHLFLQSLLKFIRSCDKSLVFRRFPSWPPTTSQVGRSFLRLAGGIWRGDQVHGGGDLVTSAWNLKSMLPHELEGMENPIHKRMMTGGTPMDWNPPYSVSRWYSCLLGLLGRCLHFSGVVCECGGQQRSSRSPHIVGATLHECAKLNWSLANDALPLETWWDEVPVGAVVASVHGTETPSLWHYWKWMKMAI